MMDFSESNTDLAKALSRTAIDREPKSQLGSLGLDNSLWSGKAICEIGSGKREELAGYIAPLIGKDGRLTIFNPEYRGAVDEEGNLLVPTEENATTIKRFPHKIEGVKLPEDSFDVVLGSFSAPMHIDFTFLGDFLSNIAQSLKRGGTARFYPIWSQLANTKEIRQFIDTPPPGISAKLRRYDFESHRLPDRSPNATLVIDRL